MRNRNSVLCFTILIGLMLGVTLILRPAAAQNQGNRYVPVPLRKLPPGVTRVSVVFSGGHDTDERDGGRPVVLIAAALGVPTEVFREAFSYVRPAPAGSQPDPRQVHANKDALLAALRPYGITNEKLDTVSDYYRYVRSRGELWPAQPAVANALVKNGRIIGYELIRGGSGYTSAPQISVPSFKSATVIVELSFGQSFESNGAVSVLEVPRRHQAPQPVD